MAFEPIYEVTHIDCVKRICTTQRVVEARLLPTGGDKIAKVLSISTDCSVGISESFAGEVRYNGRVNFKVIYASTEGENFSLDYNADFSDKLVCQDIKAGQSGVLSANILDTEIVSVDEREIKLASVVEVSFDAVNSESVNMLLSGGDDIYTHDDKIDYSNLVCSCKDNFLVSDFMSDLKCKRILLAEPKIVTIERRVDTDTVTVEGKIICNLTCEMDDGMIISYQASTNFTQDIECIGARFEDFVMASVVIENYTAMLEEDGDDSSVVLEYSVTANANVFRDETISPIVDAFSVTNELMQSGESVAICKNIINETISDRVEGSVTLDMNMPIVDNILAVTASSLNIALAKAEDGAIVFDGIVSANIIYYSAEQNVKSSVAVELPFSIKNKCDVKDGDEICAYGIVSFVATKIRRGNEIDIKADIEIEINATSGETKYVITDLSLGEERVLPTNAFSIHIAKGGETLWDVAKALSTTPEIVLLQNPTIELPLNGGERIIAYRYLR